MNGFLLEIPWVVLLQGILLWTTVNVLSFLETTELGKCHHFDSLKIRYGWVNIMLFVPGFIWII